MNLSLDLFLKYQRFMSYLLFELILVFKVILCLLSWLEGFTLKAHNQTSIIFWFWQADFCQLGGLRNYQKDKVVEFEGMVQKSFLEFL